MKFAIRWVSETIPNKDIIDSIVIPELEKACEGFSRPEELVFHTVYVRPDLMDGAIVMAYGKMNEPVIFLDYITSTGWMI